MATIRPASSEAGPYQGPQPESIAPVASLAPAPSEGTDTEVAARSNALSPAVPAPLPPSTDDPTSSDPEIDRHFHTLLDTVNHILDYSKISSFTRSQKRQPARVDALQRHSRAARGSTNSDDMGTVTHVDLARLTEEVVETVSSAFRFQNLRTVNADNLSLAINIPWRKSWIVELQVPRLILAYTAHTTNNLSHRPVAGPGF